MDSVGSNGTYNSGSRFPHLENMLRVALEPAWAAWKAIEDGCREDKEADDRKGRRLSICQTKLIYNFYVKKIIFYFLNITVINERLFTIRVIGIPAASKE